MLDQSQTKYLDYVHRVMTPWDARPVPSPVAIDHEMPIRESMKVDGVTSPLNIDEANFT